MLDVDKFKMNCLISNGHKRKKQVTLALSLDETKCFDCDTKTISQDSETLRFVLLNRKQIIIPLKASIV